MRSVSAVSPAIRQECQQVLIRFSRDQAVTPSDAMLLASAVFTAAISELTLLRTAAIADCHFQTMTLEVKVKKLLTGIRVAPARSADQQSTMRRIKSQSGSVQTVITNSEHRS